MTRATTRATSTGPRRLDRLAEITRQHWGFGQFFPLQQQAMQCVLSRRDSVVVLPTGGGKSLCYQAPALCVDKLAVVVSPLISLMKDQVDSLRANGIPAACVNSLMALDERREVAQQVRSGRLRLLYVAPERLLTQRTLDFLQSVGVAFFAIDEAHCISSWGHDFRPEYRELRQLRDLFPTASLHAFTATATEPVRHDIAEQLGLIQPEILVGSFDRPNLTYRVQRREDVLAQIRGVLDRFPQQSGIVYCISRQDVEATSGELNDLGYRTLPYHAGLPDDQRHHNQDAFVQQQVDTIVATVAFGMGIDKRDVRYVIHTGMPKSLEAYQQETGRAGRDGLPAECAMFFSGADRVVWKEMIRRQETPDPGAQRRLDAIDGYCTGAACRRRVLLEYFGESYDRMSCGCCDVCLGELEWIDEPLVVAQKILSCVLRLGERFGGDYVSSVLCGLSDQRMVERGHDRLSTFGLLASHPKKAVRDWTEQLVSQKFLQKTGEYPVLHVTAAGRQVLRGQQAPRLMKPTHVLAAPTAPADSWNGVDRGLFDQLRELRRSVADERGVPAFVIFSDASLRDMARRRPSNVDSFACVHGVGESKQRDFGPPFVAAVVEYCRARQIELDQQPPVTVPRRSPSSRAKKPSLVRRRAYELFEQGCSIDEVAARVQRAHSTTVQYLVEYINRQQVTDSSRWVSPHTAAQILAAVQSVGHCDRLAPIHAALGGNVSHDEIRIVVHCYRNEAPGNTIP